jgi:hypothetical protein
MKTRSARNLQVGASIAALVLTGCGGGGSSTPSGSVTSTLSFPLQSAYKATVAAGSVTHFTITGTCSGSATQTNSTPTSPVTFEGNTNAQSVTVTQTPSYTNCIAASPSTTSTEYYDSNYEPLGEIDVGTMYGVYQVPIVLPTSVMVGDTATLGTEALYTDSTKATANGSVVFSYVVEADTASTAIVNLIGHVSITSLGIVGIEQRRFKIAATGALVPVSIDLQYTAPTAHHEIFTAQ